MKSQKLLQSFTWYCRVNPDLRFWQALCGWSKSKAIYMLKNSCPSAVDDAIMFINDDRNDKIELVDTFNFEGKNK